MNLFLLQALLLEHVENLKGEMEDVMENLKTK